MNDKEINNLARNMRKKCTNRDSCIFPKTCQYYGKCMGVLLYCPTPDELSIKELAEELRRSGI